MKRIVVFALAAALSSLSAGGVGAQQPPPPPPASPEQPRATQPGLLIASDALIGTKVKDGQGKDLGEISKLMIDPKDGKVASAVIKQGGALGMGAKEVLVPWSALTLQRGQRQELVVTMPQPFLEQTPAASPPSGQPQNKQQ